MRIIVTVIVIIGVLLFSFIESIIIAYACADTPVTSAEFVIVPGCGIREDGSLTLTLKYRLDAALDYLSEHEKRRMHRFGRAGQ